MRVDGFEVFAVANPSPTVGGPVWFFVRLDAGTWSGFGEVAASALFSPASAVKEQIEHFVEDFVVGQDVRAIESFVQRTRNSHYSRTPDLTKVAVLSGIEIAMWDLLGKSLGVPVHVLLGGAVRDRVRMYSYLAVPDGAGAAEFWTDESAVREAAKQHFSSGFTAVKVDPFPLLTGADSIAGQFVPVQPTRTALTRAESIVAAIRAATGDGDIALGTHGQFTASGALRVASRMEPFDLLWFEEPVPPDVPLEMARVARAIRTPVAAGERLASVTGFADLARIGAASIFNPDVSQVGGVLELRKVAALAEAHGLQVTPHVFGGPIAAAASLQVAATLPNLLILEGNGQYDGPYADLLLDPLEWRAGELWLSDRPGLGHDLNERQARAWAASDERLPYQHHLSTAR